MGALQDALSHPALTVDSRELTVGDVAVAALYLGEWGAVRARAESAIASSEHSGGDATSRDDGDVAAAAEAFRRTRRLLAAEDMEAWLARRGLSAGHWMRWVRMDVVRRRRVTPPGAGRVPEAIDLYAEAICSGALARAARWLAETLVAPEPQSGPREGAHTPDPGELEPLGVDRAAALAMLDELRRRAAAVAELAQRVADAGAIAARVSAQQAEWLAIDYRMLALAQETAAREAVLCVRDDGMALEEVAQLAGVDVAHERALLCDVQPVLAAQLLSASRGELIGPVEHGDATAIVVLDAKESPSADDPEIALRARRELLTRALERELAARVRWHDRL
jgi:hypothetical protein